MAALVLATSRCRVLVLGTEVPPAQLAELARDLRARAVGLSVSAATEGPATSRRLRALRSLLPRRTALLVGGAGAPAGLPGVTTMKDDLGQLETWAHQASRSS
jgi:methylmalonyl-CoA mutase cobalamin-binding subunit